MLRCLVENLIAFIRLSISCRRKGFVMGETMLKAAALVISALSAMAIVIFWREGLLAPLPGILAYYSKRALVRLVDYNV